MKRDELSRILMRRAIVASDDDLLVLDPWNEIRIVTPADFAGAFRGSA